MHKLKLLLFLFCLNSLAHAEEKTLYDHILGLNWVFEGFDVTRTETGIYQLIIILKMAFNIITRI